MNLEKGNNEVELKTRIFYSRIKVLTLLLDMYYDVHISLFPVIKALEPVRLNKWSLPEVDLKTMVTTVSLTSLWEGTWAELPTQP